MIHAAVTNDGGDADERATLGVPARSGSASTTTPVMRTAAPIQRAKKSGYAASSRPTRSAICGDELERDDGEAERDRRDEREHDGDAKPSQRSNAVSAVP